MALVPAVLLVLPLLAAPPEPQATAAAPLAAQIQGTAILGRNQPVVGAVVVVRPDGAAGPLHLTTTDSRGAFRFDALADGRYHAELRGEGLKPVVREGIDVRAPFRAVYEVQMERAAPTPSDPVPPAPADAPPARLSGVVRSRDGAPLAETRLRLVRQGGALDPREALTGADGTFSFEALTPGRWRLTILGAGMLPVRTEVDAVHEVQVAATLVPQPANYPTAVEDLMPVEQPVAARSGASK